MGDFAGVIINRRIKNIDQIFTYKIPENLKNKIEIGMAVEVPFRTEILEAIVVEIQDKSPVKNTKELKKILATKSFFSENLLKLSKWLAQYYICSWATALQAMLPTSFSKVHKPAANMQAVFLKLNKKPERVLGPKQKIVWDFIEKNQNLGLDDLDKDNLGINQEKVISATDVSKAVINNMIKKKILKANKQNLFPLPGDIDLLEQHELNLEQEKVLTEIILAEENLPNYNKPILLHGITGSGKTEVYLQAIKRYIAKKKQCILLVPEIGLTTQITDYFQSRLNCKVAILHSALTPAEKRQTWQGINKGFYQLVIGPRSAIFAPVPNLGLIIIDEEHDESYKQEQNPRFHARTVAIKRAKIEKANIILGSATPDIESFYKAKNNKYQLLELKNRVNKIEKPRIEIVDMRKELSQGNFSVFSEKVQHNVNSALNKDEQVMLFLNRRGFNTFISCRSCGYVVECPHCSISMSYHAGINRLKCHYCGRQLNMPKNCPECNSKYIKQFGTGTEKLALEASKAWPNAKIARLDRDITKKKGNYEKIYRAMLAGEIDILVGTQMIAKGLDFPRLNLVCVIAADLSLNLPDWRASERTYQLLTQVSGRAGRHKSGGKAIFQTYQPENSTIIAATKQDYLDFYEREIAFRKLANYPPFAYFIRLVFQALDRSWAFDEANLWQKELKIKLNNSNTDIWGPSDAALSKIKDNYRVQILFRTDDLPYLQKIINQLWQLRAGNLSKNKIILNIDVEPMNII